MMGLTTSHALYAVGGLCFLLSLWGVLSYLEKRRHRRLALFASQDLLPRLIGGYAPRLRVPLNALVTMAAAFLLVAFAEPRWGETLPSSNRGSREILVLLDTSESMNATRPAPSRLARAQSKVTTLLEACSGDRFGLIAFSGAAVLQCPLTSDLAYFKTILESLTTDSLTEEGTDIASAFHEAELLFEDKRGGAQVSTRADRIFLLISDGEEVSGDAVAAAERLSTAGRIAVLGIGDPEGAEVTLPQWMQRTRHAPGGSVTHWSVLDEKTLSAIALAGDGVYVRSTLGGEDIDVILREMASLEGHLGGDVSRPRQANRYRWPLALAALCMALEGVWIVWMPHAARRRARIANPGEAAHALG